MPLDARNFSLPGQWALGANTNIPPIPISGQAYRLATLAKAAIELGQQYNVVADSATWNQILYLASGMAMESEVYGWPRWSPLTNYIGNASICLGTDGTPYRALQNSGPGVSGVGPQDPTATTGYWVSFSDYFLGQFFQPYGETGSVWTMLDESTGQMGWRMASVPSHQQVFDVSGTFTAPMTGTYYARLMGGGGGGGGCGTSSTLRPSGGGAGSGYLIESPIYLVEGEVVNAIIGAAGTGGAASTTGTAQPGVDGGASQFKDLIAPGGKRGLGGGPSGRGAPGDGGFSGSYGGSDTAGVAGGNGGPGLLFGSITNGKGNGGNGGGSSGTSPQAGSVGTSGLIIIEW